MIQLYINKIAPDHKDIIIPHWIKTEYPISVAWYGEDRYQVKQGWMVNYNIQTKTFEEWHIYENKLTLRRNHSVCSELHNYIWPLWWQ
jgi:hypothetical protein